MNPAKIDTNEEHPSEEGMEVHPAIQLLIARMESHPEEFFVSVPGRPAYIPGTTILAFHAAATKMTDQTKSLWNRKEKRLYNLALRKVRLEEAHQQLMKSLLAG